MQSLGRYRLLGELGAGGMGVVYRARDDTLDRDVAVKVLPPEFVGDPDRLRRFEREACAAAAIDHPNIVAVHDVDEHDGTPFLVTELLHGRTLRERLSCGAMPPSEAVSLVAQAVRALAAVHHRGIVHRDLKPENLFVTDDGMVKILDFGLARLRAGPDAAPSADRTETAVTGSATVVGTVGYMAPEQIRGDRVDGRADLFAIGCVLSELLTGQRPFARATGAATLGAILHEEAPPLGSGAPASVQRIVARCLRKDPDDRYRSAGELLAALEAAGESVDRPGRPKAIPRLGLAAIAGVALTLAGAATLWSPELAPPPRVRSIAVLPFSDLSGDPEQAYFADGMTETLIASLGRTSSLTVISRTSCMLFKDSELPLPEIAHRLGADAVVEGSVLRAGDRVRITAQLIDARSDRQLWADTFDRDLSDVLTLHEEAAHAIAGEVGAALSPSESIAAQERRVDPEAYDLYLRGRELSARMQRLDFFRAIDHYRRALAIDPDLAEAWASIPLDAVLLFQLNEYTYGECLAVIEECAERAVALGPQLAEAHFAKALLHLLRYQWVEHERELRRTVVLNPSESRAWVLLGQFLGFTGQTAAGRAALEKAEAVNPLDLWTMASALAIETDPNRQVFARCDQLVSRYPEAYLAHWIRGQCVDRAGRHTEAIAEYRRALELEPGFGDVMASLGSALAAADRRGEAREVLAQLEQALAEGRGSAGNVAQVRLALGDTENGYDALTRAVENREVTIHFHLAREAANGHERALVLARSIGLPLPGAD